MSNIKISELDQAGALTGQELIPIEQDNLTVRTTVQQLQKAINIVVSNDIIADEDSTTKAPSVNAIKTYTDNIVMGLVDDRGNFTPSQSLPGGFPTLNGSGDGGQIMKGDLYFIDDTGYINGVAVTAGQSIRALADNPLQDPTKWNILSAGLIQSTLQNVLNAGRIATGANAYMALTSSNGFNTLSLFPTAVGVIYDDGVSNNYSNSLAPTYSELKNVNTNNRIYQDISGANSYLSVKKGSTNNYTQLNSDSLQFYKNSFLNTLDVTTITTPQTWTLPNKTGTIALTSDITTPTLQSVLTSGSTADNKSISLYNTAHTLITQIQYDGITVGQVDIHGEAARINKSSIRIFDQDASDTYSQIALNYLNANNANGTASYLRSSSLEFYNDTTGYNGVLYPPTYTDSQSWILPDKTGTIALLSDIPDSLGWGLTGNAGTNQLVNFIGTTDNQNVVFKRNSVEYLRLDSSNAVLAKYDIAARSTTDVGVYAQSLSGNGSAGIIQDVVNKGAIVISSGTGGGAAIIRGLNLSGAQKTLELPNENGTIALTSNISLQTATLGTNKNLVNGINLQGTDAGAGNTGTANINAFGAGAATNNGGNNVNAIGANAAYGNSRANVNAIGNNAGFSNSGADVNAFGSNAANGNTGYYVNALGTGAAQGNANSQVNAIGNQTAYNNHGLYVNAIGYQVAYNNYGQAVNAMGYAAAKGNTGSDTNALGTNAALNNEGQYTNAIGNQAAVSNTGLHVNGIGQFAAEGNTGDYVNAIGSSAGYQNSANSLNAFGANAANGNTGANVNALGYSAANGNSGANVNAFGGHAADNNSNSDVNAFGGYAANTNNGQYVNAFGGYAAQANSGDHVNAFGFQAGNGNSLSHVTIFSNNSMPSYANHAAAVTALSGGSANCTYLYHNQATDSIGAVRL